MVGLRRYDQCRWLLEHVRATELSEHGRHQVSQHGFIADGNL